MNPPGKEKIIAIIPALDEEGKIGKVISRICKEASDWVDEILVIDDGSNDNTRMEAMDSGAKVVSHGANLGVGASIRTGIKYALKNNYDIAVIMGGDDQDNPREIERLLNPIIHDNFDFVQGSRYIYGGKIVNMPLFRLITTILYSLIFRMALNYPISDGTNGFRAFKLTIFGNKEINIWQTWLNRYELEPYLLYKTIKCNFKVKEIPVSKRYHLGRIGYSKMIPILDWWSILRPVILLKLGIRR